MIENQIILSKKILKGDDMEKAIRNLEENLLPPLQNFYFMNCLKAFFLLKEGYINLSKNIIEKNKKNEENLGKLYFIKAIKNLDLKDYLFSTEFLGPKFNKYKPVKIKSYISQNYIGEMEIISEITNIDFKIIFPKARIDLMEIIKKLPELEFLVKKF